MDMHLGGKVAIVTGASRGIGLACAERLASEGCKIAICARDPAALEAAATDLKSAGADVLCKAADMCDPRQVETFVDETVRRFGTVHILVNNAGGGTKPYRFEDITDQDWLAAWELNLMSAVRASRAVLPCMRAQKWGRIINISSAASIQPEAVYAHYAAAKAALNNFSKSLSRAAGPDGVMINSISVGLIQSDALLQTMLKGGAERGLTPDEAITAFVRKLRPGNVRGRPGETGEVADLVAFLASELSGYMTGANFRIDGGATMAV